MFDAIRNLYFNKINESIRTRNILPKKIIRSNYWKELQRLEDQLNSIKERQNTGENVKDCQFIVGLSDTGSSVTYNTLSQILAKEEDEKILKALEDMNNTHKDGNCSSPNMESSLTASGKSKDNDIPITSVDNKDNSEMFNLPENYSSMTKYVIPKIPPQYYNNGTIEDWNKYLREAFDREIIKIKEDVSADNKTIVAVAHPDSLKFLEDIVEWVNADTDSISDIKLKYRLGYYKVIDIIVKIISSYTSNESDVIRIFATDDSKQNKLYNYDIKSIKREEEK